MQNNTSKTNTFLLVVLVILAGVLVFRPYFSNKEVAYTPTPMPEVVDHTQDQQNDNQVPAWPKSQKFGLYYPSGWNISESYYLSPGQQGQGVPESQGAPEFTATNGKLIISWGGPQSGCSESEMGGLEYGYGTSMCLKGMTARIGLENVRNTMTQADRDLFADFILRNK